MTFNIYQIKELHVFNYGFMGWKFAQKHGFNIKDYNSVYSGEIQYDDANYALEKLFCKFNMDRPDDFHGHSLSVSDIVELVNNGTSSYYYCDSFGWVNVTQEVTA